MGAIGLVESSVVQSTGLQKWSLVWSFWPPAMGTCANTGTAGVTVPAQTTCLGCLATDQVQGPVPPAK